MRPITSFPFAVPSHQHNGRYAISGARLSTGKPIRSRCLSSGRLVQQTAGGLLRNICKLSERGTHIWRRRHPVVSGCSRNEWSWQVARLPAQPPPNRQSWVKPIACRRYVNRLRSTINGGAIKRRDSVLRPNSADCDGPVYRRWFRPKRSADASIRYVDAAA